MLSFLERPSIEVIRIEELKIKKIMIATSLQVLCSPLLAKLRIIFLKKRVLPFISHKNYRGSVTVEAAIALPLFVFFVTALLVPMQALDAERKIRTVMEQACEELSMYAYLKEEKTESEESALFSDVAAGLWLQGKLQKYGADAAVTRVQVPDANGNVVFEVLYQKDVPYVSGVFHGFRTEIVAKRRGFIGIPGKLKARESADGNAEDRGEMVYVGNEMSRYHRDRECHYLSNAYQAVSLEEAKAMRDLSGHRFQACATCKHTIGKSGTVYVTPGGRHYHGITDCSAMLSYVRKVLISEVIHLGPCSYCSGE